MSDSRNHIKIRILGTSDSFPEKISTIEMEIQSIVCISLLQGMKNINFVMQDEEMRRVKEHIGNLNIKTVY
jgi:hypothetical protein